MRRYEQIFIVKPNLSEDEVKAIIDRNSGLIERDGGAVIKLDKWGLKRLAYPINKEVQGYYVYTDFAGTPQAVTEIERLFRIDDKVMKYLTVKLEEHCDPAAAVKAAAEAKAPAESEAESEADAEAE